MGSLARLIAFPVDRKVYEGGRSSVRLFDDGELRFVVSYLIDEHPRHGCELIKEIEERVADTYSLSPGVTYPTLTVLDELGYAACGKKLYAALRTALSG